MDRRGVMVVVGALACGRTGIPADTLASASGDASDDAIDDDDDLPPPDRPRPDVGGELPPGTCAPLPPLPAGPSCDVGDAQQRIFDLQGWNTSLAVDDDAIYIIVGDWESSVHRIDKCSGDAERLGFAGSNPANIVVVDDRIRWTDYVDLGFVWEMPKRGGEPVVIAEHTMPLALAYADGWTFHSAHEGLFRIPSEGGAPELWVGPERWYVSLSYDGELLFANEGIVPGVGWIDPDEGSFGGIAVATSSDVVADCDWIFWADEYGRLQRLDRATGATQDLDVPIYRLTQDATHVYASAGDSRVHAIDKSSGAAVVVGDVPGALPWRVAVDETHVYWTFADSGDVMMAAKP